MSPVQLLQLADPLEPFAFFRSYEKDGFAVPSICWHHSFSHRARFTLTCTQYPKLDAADFEWAFRLMQHNMQAMYAHNSFGWNERDKRDEMAITDTFFLIARNSEVGPSSR